MAHHCGKVDEGPKYPADWRRSRPGGMPSELLVVEVGELGDGLRRRGAPRRLPHRLPRHRRPLALLVPDLFMAGYPGGTRLGAQLYNIAHSTVLPAAMAGLAWWQSKPFVLALGLIWLAHIGLDRLLGYATGPVRRVAVVSTRSR